MSIERSSGDLSRSFVGGTMQHVDEGAKARDGQLHLFLAADWEDVTEFDIKPFQVSKSVQIPVYVSIVPNLLMCSCVIVMRGKQCGPLHLALVAHCREWLWTKTTPDMSRREVEGSGMVDYLSIMWCIDATFRLYRNVTQNVGMCGYTAPSGGSWDGFWYIYRRGESTPAYSHIGLDVSATLNNQLHVRKYMYSCIDMAAEASTEPPTAGGLRTPSSGGLVGGFRCARGPWHLPGGLQPYAVFAAGPARALTRAALSLSRARVRNAVLFDRRMFGSSRGRPTGGAN